MKKPIATLLSATLCISFSLPGWSQAEPVVTLETSTSFQESPATVIPSCTQEGSGIGVNIQPLKVKSSHIRRKYVGFEISVTNSTDKDVAIQEADISNGYQGEEVREEIERSLFGITSVLGVGGLVLTALRRKISNKKALKEAEDFDSTLESDLLNQGESISTKTLLPKDETQPSLVLTVTDVETGQVLCQTPEVETTQMVSDTTEQPAAAAEEPANLTPDDMEQVPQ